MRSILEVVTPAASLDLTILATAKERLGITGAAMDDKIAMWIKVASDAIASACNRVMGQETVRQTIYVDRSTEALVLDRYPVASISAVTVDGTALASTEYVSDKTNGLLLRTDAEGNLLCWSAGRVEVSYVGGYLLLDELPYDIEEACVKLVVMSRAHATRDPMAKRIEVPGVQTVDYWVGSMSGGRAELPPDVLALIQPFKRYNI